LPKHSDSTIKAAQLKFTFPKPIPESQLFVTLTTGHQREKFYKSKCPPMSKVFSDIINHQEKYNQDKNKYRHYFSN
jgi:hypothetical protein